MSGYPLSGEWCNTVDAMLTGKPSSQWYAWLITPESPNSVYNHTSSCRLWLIISHVWRHSAVHTLSISWRAQFWQKWQGPGPVLSVYWIRTVSNSSWSFKCVIVACYLLISVCAEKCIVPACWTSCFGCGSTVLWPLFLPCVAQGGSAQLNQHIYWPCKAL